jgi:hypothetical protein
MFKPPRGTQRERPTPLDEDHVFPSMRLISRAINPPARDRFIFSAALVLPIAIRFFTQQSFISAVPDHFTCPRQYLYYCLEKSLLFFGTTATIVANHRFPCSICRTHRASSSDPNKVVDKVVKFKGDRIEEMLNHLDDATSIFHSSRT